MNLTLVLLLVFGLIAFLIFWKLTKFVIKAIFMAIVIVIVFISLIGILVILDFNEIQDSITEKETLMVLHEGNNVLTAINIEGVDPNKISTIRKLEDRTLPVTEISQLASLYAENKLKAIRGEHDQVIFVDISYLDKYMPKDSAVQKEMGKTKEEILTRLREPYSEQNNAYQKNLLFIESFILAFEKSSSLGVLNAVRNGLVQIYEEPMSFAFI